MKDSTQAGESQILSITSVNKSVNSISISIVNRSTLSGPTFAGATAPKPAASTLKGRELQISRIDPGEIHDLPRGVIKNKSSDRVPKGANDPVALHYTTGRWRTWTLLHLRPPHVFVAFRRETKKGGYLV